MDNPATPATLILGQQRGYRGPASPAVQQTRLDESWRALQAELPGLVAWINAGTVDQAIVVDVVAAAALRVLRNPEGVEEESGSIDDYSESRKLADATDDLYFTAAELRRLQQQAAVVPTAGSMKYC